MHVRNWMVAAVLGLAVAGVAAAASSDFGLQKQKELYDKGNLLFGVQKPVEASSTVDLNAAQALADPAALVTMAKGLDVHVLAAGAADDVGSDLDQMVLWPPSNPTHIIGINEEGPGDPGLQKIDLKTGEATTIVSGTDSGDPVRATPWGTIVFGEESGDDGAMYELIDPLSVEGATINRTTGASSSPKIRRLDALGFTSFEGLAILPNGVTYYGNELSANGGAAAGAYFKFVPGNPWGGGAAITSLDQSPYASGSIFALRVGTTGNPPSGNYGQGFQYGRGVWRGPIPGNGAALQPLAVGVQATGYYRPEDISIDENALGNGNMRFCGNNTGRDAQRYWGETICITDGTVAGSASGSTAPEVQLLVQGSLELDMPDNIAFQPGRGNWIIHEDGSTTSAQGGARNNDLWSCLDDGADDDTLSDGCVRIGTINDFDAEWTGGFFDPSGQHFYVSIQHNDSGFGTILDITGWK
jgi:Alkaline phosphatase PhoX